MSDLLAWNSGIPKIAFSVRGRRSLVAAMLNFVEIDHAEE